MTSRLHEFQWRQHWCWSFVSATLTVFRLSGSVALLSHVLHVVSFLNTLCQWTWTSMGWVLQICKVGHNTHISQTHTDVWNIHTVYTAELGVSGLLVSKSWLQPCDLMKSFGSLLRGVKLILINPFMNTNTETEASKLQLSPLCN